MKKIALLIVLLPIFLRAQGITTTPEQRCIVQGRVTNAQTGEPVRKASVRLVRHKEGMRAGRYGMSSLGYAGTSETDGSFRFEAVEPGDYVLMGERSGFITTQYGAKSARASGQTITLRPSQEMTGLGLALIRQAVISGKVVDDDGDPVGDSMVQALHQIWMRGKPRYIPYGNAESDDRGEFRIANLEPGKYYVLALGVSVSGASDAPALPGKPDVRQVRTFYPDSLTRESAAAIHVSAGQNATGMDIHLRSSPTYHVRGKVLGNVPESDPDRLMLNIGSLDEEFPMTIGRGPNVKKDHTFDLAGVAPGAYAISLLVMGGRFRNLGRQIVEVGSGDLDGVVLTAVQPGTIRGQVHMDGTPPAGNAPPNLAQIHLLFMSADQGQMFSIPQPSIKADGSLTLDNVNPGVYYPQATNGPEGAYLKSIRYGQQEVLGKELDLTQNTAGDLQVIFRYGPAEVDGAVESAQDAIAPSDPGGQAPSVSVLLIPDTLNADGSGWQSASTNQNRVFAIKQVSPGHYHAVALEQADMNQFQNPEVLKQLATKGVDVEVKENDKKQIQLQIIPAAEVRQIQASAGIEEE